MQFKAFFAKPSQQHQEIRRFCIANPTYDCILNKVRDRFQVQPTEDIKLEYLDTEGDRITFSSNEELHGAIESAVQVGNEPLMKIWVSLKGDKRDCQAGIRHPRVSCDGCQTPLEGFRFKCLVCEDYDLCSPCLTDGLHTEHPMVLLRQPDDYRKCPPGMWRRMCHRRFGGPHAGGFMPHMFGFHRPPPDYSSVNGFPVFNNTATQHEKSEHSGTSQTEASNTAETCQTETRTTDAAAFNDDLCSAVNSFMKTVLHPLGVEATVNVSSPEHKDGATKTELANFEQAIQASLITEATRIGKSKDDQATTTQKTDLDDEPMQQTNSPSPTDFIVVESAQIEERVQRSLEHMKAMGFSDDGGWLTRLLLAKDGDICKVLDAIRPSK